MKAHRLAALTFVLALLPRLALPEESAELFEHLQRATALPDGPKQVTQVHFGKTNEGWKKTGIELVTDEAVTLFAHARGIEDAFGATTRAKDVLWVRVGESETWNIGSETETLVAPTSGELEVAVRPRNIRWLDCRGAFPEHALKEPGEAIEVSVVAAVWKADPSEGLRRASGHESVQAAIEDLAQAPRLPRGFQSLCHLPKTRVHAAFTEGTRRGVRGKATGKVEIIKKPLDLPLTENSLISFDWRYDAVPALGPETDARTHDYSSIAIEFENGQDITWMRSATVPAGTSFRCPLNWWDERETHIVLESGRDGLGAWSSHTRNIAADYDRAVSGERPTRIVGVWFISVGAFGNTLADATFADVTIETDGRTVEVFEAPEQTGND